MICVAIYAKAADSLGIPYMSELLKKSFIEWIWFFAVARGKKR